MRAEDEVVTSPLSRALDIGSSQHLVITVFKGTLDGDDWLFEVLDSQGHMNISPEMYATDQAALDAALQTIGAL